MLGLGTVGTGVAHLLSHQKKLVLKKVAVKDINKSREIALTCPITADAQEVIDDPEIEIVIEVMGGEEPALSLLKRALEKRKHVVTANKEVLAKHGPELFALARSKGVAIFYEASVAGGVPLISTIHKGLEANKITSVVGILNGTTNFILSSMEEQGADYEDALAKAQQLGFAEADPTNDVEGFDVAYKLSILCALAFGQFPKTESIHRQGITQIRAEDLSSANDFGYRVKLIASASRHNGNLDVRVHPMLVPLTHPLSNVSGSNNGILVTGDVVGELIMVGPGAGQMPTASAIVGDTINLASALQLPDFASYFHTAVESDWADVSDPGAWRCPYYIKLLVKDHPGVIGQIGTTFGAHDISMRSIVQRDVEDGGASIIIITHAVQNSAMDEALSELKSKEFMDKVESCLRIFQPGVRHG